MRPRTAAELQAAKMQRAEAHSLWTDGAWDRLAPAVMAWAWMAIPGIGRDEAEDIEDVVAATLVRCFMLQRVPDDPAAFVTVVARNLWHDLHKRSYGRNKVEYKEAHDPVDPAPDPEERVDYSETIAVLRQALATLPAFMRKPLYLFHMKRRSHEEIAEALGISVGVSKMRVHRGMLMLREYFGAPASVPKPVPRKRRKQMSEEAREAARQRMAHARQVLAERRATRHRQKMADLLALTSSVDTAVAAMAGEVVV